MGAVVSAVVGCDNDGVLIAEKLINALYIIYCTVYAVEIFLAHPAVTMAAVLVGVHHI